MTTSAPSLLRRAPVGLAVVLAAAFAVPSARAESPAVVQSGTRHAAVAGTSLDITAQSFNLALDASIDITLSLPDNLDSGTLGAGASVVVGAHAAIVDHEAFIRAVDGVLGSTDDEFEIFLDPTLADPHVIRPTADTLVVTVPTESLADTDAALYFAETGIHPLKVELVINGRTIVRTDTFVHLASGEGFGGDMSVGLLMGQTIEPTIATDGTVAATPADTDELGRLADTLAAIDAVPIALGIADTVPRSVFVEPSTLQAVTNDDPALAGRLTPGLMASSLVAAPRLPFEPSAAAAAGQGDRYTTLLSEGEDLLAQLVPRTDVSRTLHVVREPFSPRAAELLRKTVGSRLMVMDFGLYDEAEGGNGPLTDTTQLVTIALPDGSSVLSAIIDPNFAQRLDEGSDDPLRTSIQIVADLLVIAQSIDDDGGIVSRHGMVLARSDVGVPDAALMSNLVTLLLSTDGLRLVNPEELGSIVDPLLKPGGSGEVAVRLPDTAGDPLDDRIALIDDISEEIFAFASMLPESAPEIDDWLRVLDALPSTAVDDRSAARMVEGLRSDFDVYLAGIAGPEPFTFTLTGRTNTVTFSLRNTTDTELEVRVRLSSPKLTFPDGDKLVVLPPQAETEVNVRAEALSNGKSSVFLRVYSPAESSDIELMPEVVLTARVSSLAGLGQLLTGAGLLLLLTWWGRHWQQTRRKRIAADHAGRHPSSNGVAAVHELAPDAAASSLPPS